MSLQHSALLCPIDEQFFFNPFLIELVLFSYLSENASK